MITTQEVVKELCKLGLSGIQVEWCSTKEMLYYDLNTLAKSQLHLYEDFTVCGRYDYTNKIDYNQELSEIVSDLYWEFDNCLKGRPYYNSDWKEVGVKLGLVEKVVETRTTINYL